MNKMKRERVAATAGVVAAAVLFVFFVPLPFSVKCNFEIQPRGGQQVYTPVPGQITEVAYLPGEQVQPGDVLMQLENPELELQLLDLEGRYRQAEEAYSVLYDTRYNDKSAVDQLDVAREVRDSAKKQWEEKLREAQQLTITATAAGKIIPPPAKSDKISLSQGRLPTWEGTPFDERNRGALLLPTDLICQIGDPHQMDAVLIIDQAYIDLVHEGQNVRVLLEAYTHKAHETTIEEIATTEVKNVSRGMSTQTQGRLETKPDAAGQFRPLNTSYQARAPLTDLPAELQAGMQGQARIYTGWQPLAKRFYRYCAKTFHFDL
jgi:putative peptide zinc metalloprotease protein